MSIFGKLTGFLLGAPFGFSGMIIGLLIGQLVDLLWERQSAGGPFGADSLELVRHLFALFGRVSGFGGGVTPTQLLFLQSILQNQLRLPVGAGRQALAAFRDSVATASQRPWSEVLNDTGELARELYNDFFLDRRTLLWTYQMCRRLAALGTLRPGIVELLDEIARAFVIFEEVGTAGVAGGRPHDSYDEHAWEGFRPASEATPDAWATLGLKPGASDDEVKKAYRKLVREFHPDSHSHLKDGDPTKKKAAEQFIKIQQAYERITKRS